MRPSSGSSSLAAAQGSPGRIRPVTPRSRAASPTARPASANAAAAACPSSPSCSPLKADFYSPPPGFSLGNPDLPVAVAVMGDLHLAPEQMPLFYAARDHLTAAMADVLAASEGGGEEGEDNHDDPADAAGPPRSSSSSRQRLAQLGDLGAYEHAPGTAACFEAARDYLDSFGAPRALVLGNHDLEAHDVETDERNVADWSRAFSQRHHWAADVGPATFVGLSTVRFRSNAHSAHEVYVDDAQVAWLDALLASLPPGRPVVVLTHAPPQGCGLRSVQAVHVRNRCAWLCHSDRPRRFLELVERHAPKVRLWFSGHFHLSQQYADSVSVVAGCAFVQTGVAGECHRDGFRQSRLLKLTQGGYELYTVDHTGGGRRRLDLAHAWADVSRPPVVCTPPGELLGGDSPTPSSSSSSPPDGGWLRSRVECGLAQGAGAAASLDEQAPGASQAVEWFAAGGDVLLALQDGLLVEYDLPSRAPVGLVAKLPEEEPPAAGEGARGAAGGGSGGGAVRVRLVDARGTPVDPLGDGADAVAVVIYGADGSEVERVPRNGQGGFFRIFQENKWRKKKAAAAAALGEAVAVR